MAAPTDSTFEETYELVNEDVDRPETFPTKTYEEMPQATPLMMKNRMSRPGLPAPRENNRMSRPGLPAPKENNNTSRPGLPAPREYNSTSRPGLPAPTKNNSVSRPGLPAPMQEEYIGQTYSEIPVDSPALPPDDLYQEMPESPQGITNKPSVSPREALREALHTHQHKPIKAVRQLPPTPDKQIPEPPSPQTLEKKKGFNMLGSGDIDTLKINNARIGLRPTAQHVFVQQQQGEECKPPSGKDPSGTNFLTKLAMFDMKVEPLVQHRPPVIIRQDKLSHRNSSGSDKSNSSDSGIGFVAPGNRPAPPLPEPRLEPASPQGAGRTLPPLPAGEPTKRSLPSRPLPDVPDPTNLCGFPWYFGNIDRKEANSRIRVMNVDGSFLVRDSATDRDSPYTLILFFDNKVRSLRLRIRRDKMFAIGTEKPDEECFANIPEVIEYHKQYSIILAGSGGGETQLTQHPVLSDEGTWSVWRGT